MGRNRAAAVVASVLALAIALPPGGVGAAEADRADGVGIEVHRADLEGPPVRPVSGTSTERVVVELADAEPAEDLLSVLRARGPVDEVERAGALVEELGSEVVVGIDGLFPAIVIPDDPEILRELDRRGWSLNVSRDDWNTLAAPTERVDPPWGVDRLDQYDLPLDGVHRQGDGGAGVLVYVVDTGLTPAVGEFAAAEMWWGGPNGWSIGESNLAGRDCEGHGTHVAGTVAGRTYGVAPAARLISVKANFVCEPGFSTSTLLWWLDWIVRDRDARGRGTPAVVNLSLGGARSAVKDRAISTLIARGITVVAAAGNEGSDACRTWPAGVRGVIAVGASDASDRLAAFSNTGRCVDVIAPGSRIPSTTVSTSLCPVPGYSDVSCLRTTVAEFSGTSMAAPHVAGLAARQLSSTPGAKPAAVGRAIVGGAVPRVTGAPRGTTDRLATSLFLEGPDPTILRTPDLRDLRIGSTVGALTISGGVDPEVSLVGGSLPDGISVRSDGRLIGTVGGHGSGTATFEVTDAFDRSHRRSVPWSAAGTPDPSQLAAVAVTPGNRTLSIDWTGFDLTSTNRGAPITRIEVRATPTTGGRARTCTARPARGTLPGGCTVTGLNNDTPHTIEIRAQNRTGWSTWADATSIDDTIADDDRTPGPVDLDRSDDAVGPDVLDIVASDAALRPGGTARITVTVKDASGVSRVRIATLSDLTLDEDGAVITGAEHTACGADPWLELTPGGTDRDSGIETWTGTCTVPDLATAGTLTLLAEATDARGNRSTTPVTTATITIVTD